MPNAYRESRCSLKTGKSYTDKIPEFPAERNKQNVTRKIAVADNQLTGSAVEEYNGESKITSATGVRFANG